MRTANSEDSNGRPLGTIVATTKGENTGGQPEEINNFRDQVLWWRSDGILAFPMVGSLQILVTGWKVEFVQVSHVLDSAFCPWRRSNQVERTIK